MIITLVGLKKFWIPNSEFRILNSEFWIKALRVHIKVYTKVYIRVYIRAYIGCKKGFIIIIIIIIILRVYIRVYIMVSTRQNSDYYNVTAVEVVDREWIHIDLDAHARAWACARFIKIALSGHGMWTKRIGSPTTPFFIFSSSFWASSGRGWKYINFQLKSVGKASTSSAGAGRSRRRFRVSVCFLCLLWFS